MLGTDEENKGRLRGAAPVNRERNPYPLPVCKLKMELTLIISGSQGYISLIRSDRLRYLGLYRSPNKYINAVG